MTWLLFIVGAMVAGFVQGLTGFAFALIAMSFWVWVLSPQIAAPLVVFASVWSHLISLSNEQKHPHLNKSLILPYLIAGLIGVPVGTYLLHIIQPDTFKLVLGLFLVLWCPIMFFNPQFPRLQQTGKFADSLVGFIGGILGGLGGFCGSLPSAWVMLKNLSKQEQRYILRHFNFGIQLFTLLAYLLQGTLEIQLLPYMALLLVSVSFPAILGAKLFYKISERQFKHTVLSLLFTSGGFLIFSTLL
ncbi:sulfite exporter TauE/SafE family protein [Acinetobacter sp. ANC 4862]|uniref:sulfite exporter TauE/SafE family protein n=1 Tax=Acinetobacter sp. ANC 4862 TaxID=2529849 RepID=UPI00103CA68C|nr:sulfite exporter TauE/SafE family protein [Acinetobacter sp. ANC 4862]TCH65793.1 sulfite exporter TauE/SafE family protein [Acinetobacter sp. ANC 4862]